MGLISQLILGLINGLILWLLLGLIFGLISELSNWSISGQSDAAIENKKFTNQGIWISATNAVFFGLLFGLLLGLIFGLLFWLLLGSINGLLLGLILGSINGLNFGLNFGGATCLKHFTLRLILYRNGYIPWNYARFLDYCTERLFLQRVGGRYRFIHKLLQDHFAQMEFRKP